MQTHDIKGVEIFSAGKWNGDEYSVADLETMVRAFEENKDHVRPFLKLGHSEDQRLLEAEGLPAAGWVERVYRKGEKLLADFADIPAKIYELIKLKAYRKVSCEIYLNCQIQDKKYPYFLGAVALLGAETPGVMNLDDILASYRKLALESKKLYASQLESSTIKSYSFEAEELQPKEEKPMSKTEKEIELEAKLAALEAEVKVAEEKAAALEGENKKFAAEKAEAAEKLAQAELEKAVEGLVGEKLITPAMKPYVAALLGKEKAEFSIGSKTMKKDELVKELLKLFQAVSDVNLDESSTDSEGTSGGGKTAHEKLEQEIEQYARENKVSYSVAYKAVAKKYEAELAPKPLGAEQ